MAELTLEKDENRASPRLIRILKTEGTPSSPSPSLQPSAPVTARCQTPQPSDVSSAPRTDTMKATRPVLDPRISKKRKADEMTVASSDNLPSFSCSTTSPVARMPASSSWFGLGQTPPVGPKAREDFGVTFSGVPTSTTDRELLSIFRPYGVTGFSRHGSTGYVMMSKASDVERAIANLKEIALRPYVSRLHHPIKPFGVGVRAARKPASVPTNWRLKENEPCAHCGVYTHKSQSCPSRALQKQQEQPRCQICSTVGHVASVCPEFLRHDSIATSRTAVLHNSGRSKFEKQFVEKLLQFDQNIVVKCGPQIEKVLAYPEFCARVVASDCELAKRLMYNSALLNNILHDQKALIAFTRVFPPSQEFSLSDDQRLLPL